MKCYGSLFSVALTFVIDDTNEVKAPLSRQRMAKLRNHFKGKSAHQEWPKLLSLVFKLK